MGGARWDEREELLVRIDERLRAVQRDVEQLKGDVAAIREVQVRYDPDQFVPRFAKTTLEWEDYSERQHLRAIVRWMHGNGLLTRLRAKDWRGFTRGYNGPGQVDRYAGLLETAYARRSLERTV